ncbi:MAG: tetratricopeptide repeat protein [Deltaproteobacteria bacterium]|nr:tetratricopeptide repeat protein [Deltaproteobacteria bacterium]MBW2154574.1 tetratricopeptide repeat protein [Deltaproteobacteria bacterium]
MTGDELQKLFGRAISCLENNDLDAAEDLIESVIERIPDSAEAFHVLGLIAMKRGEIRQAGRWFERAANSSADEAKYHYNYGVVLQQMGEMSRAVAAYEKALALDPYHIEARNNLAAALRDTFCLYSAEKHAREVLSSHPQNVNAWNNLGSILRDQGRIEEALDAYRRALSCGKPNSVVHSNLLLCMHYRPECNAGEIFKEHQRWAAIHCGHLKRMSPKELGDSFPKRLSIGYVSADFRSHSVAFFLKPLLYHHDRNRFTIYCYDSGTRSDTTTDWFRKLPVTWREIHHLTDEAAARQIREDGIHILVDCSGHTDGNRLKVFAMKPAAVQVTYLGYPNTTGLSEIDYRLTDAVADPVGEPTPATEALFRLPDGFLCYRPPDNAPSVNLLPALCNGHITFGCFSSIPKLNTQVLELWAKLLLALPSAVLMLKARQFKDTGVAASVESFFVKKRVLNNRIRIVGETSSVSDHLRWYQQVDIALDPFPYNGTTSTYEALFMGVPVITLKGKTHAGRVGASIMTRVGLSEFAVSTLQRYIELASFLSRNLELLSRIRASLRQKLMACNDGVAFTRQIESAFRHMWEKRCLRGR